MRLGQTDKSTLSKYKYSQSSSRPIKVRPLNKATVVMQLTLLSLTSLTIYGFFTFDYKDINMMEAIRQTLVNLKLMFFEPHLKHFGLGEAMYQLLVTVGLAFLTTLIGACLSLFLGLLAAENLASRRVSYLIKGLVAIIRAVPTVLWVLIFAVAAGLGSIAAVIGMTFHTVGYLVKAFSESFEELDHGVIEALEASGANWWQIVFQAVIPSSSTYLLSWTFMRFEINFAVAVAMGAVAGAGGLGFELYMASGHYFDVREVGMITYLVLAFAVILETISTKMKNRLKESV
jgi:phosphonate transport system permease protein